MKVVRWNWKTKVTGWSDLPEMDGVVFCVRAGRRDEVIIALGVEEKVEAEEDALPLLQEALLQKNEWWFGTVSYEARNETEGEPGRFKPHIPWPKVFFIKPKVVMCCQRRNWFFYKGAEYLDLLDKTYGKRTPGQKPISLKPLLEQSEYMKALEKVRMHLQRGDIYEVNYCQEFRAEGKIAAPWKTFLELDEKTEAPQAAYVKLGQLHLLCGSPERYVKRLGNKLISQPIKGTIRRGATDEEDDQLKTQLKESRKEQAENVMIVDLVRNDLSRIAMRASVMVEKLFGAYTFKTVHHLISTITSIVPADTTFADVLKVTFPMGSMTGAPKVKAMQISDETEASARGIYSGTVGHISPDGDFDFNVVIRSIVYDDASNKISLHVGGAITMQSSFESEYQECLLKAEAIRSVLEQS